MTNKVHQFVAALLITMLSASATAQSTMGTDFWFTFMFNNSTPDATTLILSAQRACTATISNPNTGWTTTVNIGANSRVDVNVPMASGYITTSEAIEYKACHIVATDTISAYTMNFTHASFDGGHLLPTPTLLDDYIIQTYTTNLYGSEFAIVATENNTVVDITPTAATEGGHAANATYSITLNQGQVYQVKTASATTTFAGSHVQARDCKRIAVFGGHPCANVPVGCTYCDHIYEPMIPVAYWGTRFIPTTSSGRSKDEVRITVLNDNTQVRKNNTLVATLGAGQSYDYELTSTEGSCFFETSGPAVCYLYLVGQNCGGTNGDPSMVLINPIEQSVKNITFGTYQDATHTYNHYVNVVTKTNNVASVRLDGTNISNRFAAVTGNAEYSFARVNITHAGHTLQCDSGFIAHIYGLAEVTSYAYSVGASVRPLNAPQLFINDINVADLPDSSNYCAHLDINFNIEIDGDHGAVNWDFGDGTIGEGNPIIHVYEEPGIYTVNINIEGVSNGCLLGSDARLSRTISIPPPDPIIRNVTVCGGGFYVYYGDTLREAGVYPYTVVTGADCDSLIELHLSFVPAEPVPLNVVLCPGESYWMNGKTYSQAGVYYDSISTGSGCDSIVELHLSYSSTPTVSLGADRLLCSEKEFPLRLAPSLIAPGSNPTFAWNTGETSSSIEVNYPGVFSINVTNSDGCVGSASVNISVQEEVVVDIEQTSDFCEGGVTTLVATTNASELLWNTGATTNEVEVHSYGRYSVKATEGACSTEATYDITQCPFDIYFPNCITASRDDGLNDEFRVFNNDNIAEFEIFIYDRWGILVYHSTDPNFSWNGKVNGKVATNQIFSWRAFAKPKTENKKYAFNGSIFVL